MREALPEQAPLWPLVPRQWKVTESGETQLAATAVALVSVLLALAAASSVAGFVEKGPMAGSPQQTPTLVDAMGYGQPSVRLQGCPLALLVRNLSVVSVIAALSLAATASRKKTGTW